MFFVFLSFHPKITENCLLMCKFLCSNVINYNQSLLLKWKTMKIPTNIHFKDNLMFFQLFLQSKT